MNSQKLTDHPLYLSGNQPQNQNQNQLQDNPQYLSQQNFARNGPGIGQGTNVPNFNNPGMGPQFTNPSFGQGSFNAGMSPQFNYQQGGNGFYNPGMDARFTNQSRGQGAFNPGMDPRFINQPGNGFNQGRNNNFGGMNYGNINQFQQNKMNGPYGQNQEGVSKLV